MPTFRFPDDFKDHKQYIVLLKKALVSVKADSQKKFLYFKQYPFGPKKLPLVLVDFDLNCPAALKKAGHAPTDEGMVSLTAQGELNFEAKKGNLKRSRIKKYFASMGGGIRPVYVPPGETDEEGDLEAESESTETKAADQKVASDETETKRKQLLARIQELQSKTFPEKIELLKKPALEKANSLVQSNKFAEATLLLDQLALKAVSAPVQAAPTQAASPVPAQSYAEIKNRIETALFPVTGAGKPFLDLQAELNRLNTEYKAKAATPQAAALLKGLADKLPVIEDAFRRESRLIRYRTGLAGDVKAALGFKSYGNKPLDDAIEDLRKTELLATADPLLGKVSGKDVDAAFGSLQAKLGVVQKLSVTRISDLAARKDIKKSEARAQAVASLESDPRLLQRLAADSAGRALLDDLVADIGQSAKGKSDKAFMTAALEARFGKVFKGDLSESAMPRLYSVFRMVPDAHVRDNPKLKDVKRNKNYEPASFYTTDADEDEGVRGNSIVLNGVRTGGLKGWTVDTLVSNMSTTKYRNVKGDKKINAFDAVTLHEIGHSVDEKESFMAKRSGNKEYGAWMDHDIEEIADIAGNSKGFYADFKDQPRQFLRAYLLRALAKGFDPDKVKNNGEAAATTKKDELLSDPGVKLAEAERKKGSRQAKDAKKQAQKAVALTNSAKKALALGVIDEIIDNDREAEKAVAEQLSLAPGKNLDWKKLAKHDAVNWCTAIKLSGADSGLWEKGEAASKLAVDGRIYHEAYKDDWYSYDASARAQRVTNYQFRAPGEWFADAYSAYYLSKLPDGHPLGAWLDTQPKP